MISRMGVESSVEWGRIISRMGAEFAEVVHALPNAETHGVISLQLLALNGSSWQLA